MPTIANILSRIALVISGAKSEANLVRPILQDSLNVSTSFYSSTIIPDASADNTLNYRPGSLGVQTSSGRKFLCTNASTGAAVWERITIDSGHEDLTITDGSTTNLQGTTATVAATCGAIDEAFIAMPLSPYLGKTVDILILGSATTGVGIIKNGGGNLFSGEAFNNYFSIRMVCTDVATNTWKAVQLAFN